MRFVFSLLFCMFCAEIADAQFTFFDDFTRGVTNNPLSPWTVGIGIWNVANGVMQGTGSAAQDYSDCYVPGTWTNFTIQGQIQLPNPSWACGFSGRLNPSTGARYVANVYPEWSPLGPGSYLRLIKFHSWRVWSSTFTPMALVPLPGVGTNSHILKMAFQSNQISVYYDGLLVVQMLDTNVDGLTPYNSGAAGAHMYLGDQPYYATFDNVSITPLPANSPPLLPGQTNRTIPPLFTLTVTNTATDQDYPPNLITYSLSGPTNASISTNGVITWTPTAAQDLTTNVFTTVATDFNSSAPPVLQHLSATNSFIVVVNSKAVVVSDTTAVVQENCSPANNAVDPGETVTVLFALKDAGFGNTTNLVATLLATNGVVSPSGPQSYGALTAAGASVSQPFTFTASGACGGTVNPTFQLQDGSYNLGLATFTIPFGQLATAYTQNFDSVSGPVLPSGWTTTASGAQASWVTQAGTNNTAPNVAFTADAANIGINELISPTFAMPPGLSQLSFSHYYDLEVNTATEGFDGGVLEMKIGTNAFTDILAAGGSFVTNGYDHTISTSFGNPLAGRQAWSGTSPGFITTLVNLPASAANQNVQFKWRCGTDNGNALSGWRVDSVGIKKRACCTPGAIPVIAADTFSLTAESCAPTNNAIDPGETVTMLFGLKDIGTVNTSNLVATLLSTNGITSPSAPQSYGALTAGGATVSQPFSFAATGVCAGTITATFTLQDGVLNLGTVSFPLTLGQFGTVFTQNFDSVTAPALPSGWTTTASGVQSNWVTQTATNKTAPNAAFSPDPANVGVNELVSPAFTLPTGASQLSFANYYDLETNGNNAAEAFDGGVLEIKIGTNAFSDILAAGGSFAANGYDHTISINFSNPLGGRQAWSGTSSGFITTVLNLPASAAGQSVQLKWRCGTDNSNGKTGWRVDSIGVSGTVCCLSTNSGNSPPVLPGQSDRTIVELTTLTVTNTATDSNTPPNGLTYSLQNPPAGAAISTNGIISWTPSEAQAPSTNTITTIVSDNTQLSATNSFKVVVTETNTAPSLPAQTNRTIAELTVLVVTNTASDSDIPANVLSYSLQNAPAGATISSNGVINWTPSEAQGPGTNAITTVVTDNGIPPLSATNSFTVVVTELNSAPLLPNQTNRTIAELTALNVTNTATDSDIPANILTYNLQNPPAGATISTNGVINWTPTETQGPSSNTITTVVADNGVPPLSATNSFTVVVTEVNSAPSLPVQTSRTIAELTALVVTNTASDPDIPANVLTYTLQNPPAGATVSSNGIINWTPTEAQGPSTNTITTVVTDNGVPPLSATNSFTVVVTEVNSAPSLPNQTNRTIAELTALVVTNTASDSDIPANILTYALQNPPTAATISTNGVINWTPSEAQGPTTNTITTVVTDNGVPPLSATNSFTVVVIEMNSAPSLSVQTNRTIAELTTLVVTNTATDSDLPPNHLVYLLENPPIGMTIDTNGVITWTPGEAQGPGTNTIVTVVTDDGAPPLSATNTFTIVVNEINSPPVLPQVTNYTIGGMTPFAVTNQAVDTDIPANTLNYLLATAPTNATVDANGVIRWTPTVEQVPSTNIFETVVTDNNPWAINQQHLSATNRFVVAVTAIHNGPSLSAQPDVTINELATVIVTNTASDGDIPALPLTYELVNAPASASISADGVITWKPDEAEGPSTNEFVTVVYDNGVPPLSATNIFTVVVNEVNSAPILPVQTNRTLNGFATIVITNTATDADIPVNALSYAFLTAPTNAVIDSEGIITWTPTADQIPGTNIFETVVTDDNPLAVNSQHLSATNSFAVITEVHNPPVLSPQPDITIDELSTLVVTNPASAFNNPALFFSYQLINPPGGATIDTNGVITWQVSEAEGPTTNTITTVVSDSGNRAFTATNSFTVVVNELNTAPVLPDQSDRTIAGLATLTVTNTATDSDIPANPLSYELVNAPSNAVISADGIISWTPNTNDVPSTNIFETVVTDSSPFAVNAQHLSATNQFAVIVQAVHSPPVLPAQANRTILELVTLTVTNNATESDVPPLPLTYELASPPAGAVIDTNGVITWTPAMSQCPTTNLITTIVSDGGGVSGLSATNSFFVIVQPQLINIQSIKISNQLATITWSAVLNQKYRLQYKDNPLQSNWTDLLPDITANDSTASGTNGISSSNQRFYRVYLVP